MGEQRCVELKDERERRVGEVREEMEREREERVRGEEEQQQLQGLVAELRAELKKLEVALSEQQLEKETLQFQISSQDGTISSLRSQVR